MDLHAAIAKPVQIHPGQCVAIPTGLSVAIPESYEGQIRARSGLAKNHGITLANGIGTLDQDFRGHVHVLLVNLNLWNHGPGTTFEVQPQSRIAQLVICPIFKVEWLETEDLDDTERGSNGFGSTGTA